MDDRKKRIFEIIQVGRRQNDKASYIYDIVMLVVVLLNMAIAIFDTFAVAASWQPLIFILELLSVVFFGVDYILRIWTADLLYPNMKRSKAIFKFVFSVSGLVDLLSFLPFFVTLATGQFKTISRIFRVMRIFRLFRARKYFMALDVIMAVLHKKKGQLLSSLFIVIILMIIASLIMYQLESAAQPEVFKNAFSGFWWAASTLLTVGYGDIVPITFMGRFMGTVMTFLGVCLIAIPTGILSAGFMELTSKERCPHCGKRI